MEEYLSPTYYIDSDHPSVNEFASKNCDGDEKIAIKAVQLYKPLNVMPIILLRLMTQLSEE